MQILCDTNVLIRAMKPDDPRNPVVVSALSVLRARNDELAIVPQNCYEYYVVATRPVAQNGLGLSSQQAMADIDDFLAIFRFLRDERTVFRFWKDVVANSAIIGKQAHDARSSLPCDGTRC
jgi:hypothetical protein